MAQGKVVQVIGSVVDVEFAANELPSLYNSVRIQRGAGFEKQGLAAELYLEVAGELGNNKVRCLALGSTDGVYRGQPAEDTGAPISVPVGRGTLGRVFNVLGQAIDQAGEVKFEKKYSIH